MIFHIAVCSPDAGLRSGLERQCMEFFARRADACIVEHLPDTDALLRKDGEGVRYELYLLAAPVGLAAAGELRRRGRRAPLAFVARTTAHAYSAYKVDALQYLLLPVRQRELSALLARATEPEYGPSVTVNTAEGLRALPYAGIEYLECTHHIVHFHLTSGEDVPTLSLRVPFSAPRGPDLHPPRAGGCRAGRLPAMGAAAEIQPEITARRCSHSGNTGVFLRKISQIFVQSSAVQSGRNWSHTCAMAGASSALAASCTPSTVNPALWAVEAA